LWFLVTMRGGKDNAVTFAMDQRINCAAISSAGKRLCQESR
jgi:hypothetical protein